MSKIVYRGKKNTSPTEANENPKQAVAEEKAEAAALTQESQDVAEATEIVETAEVAEATEIAEAAEITATTETADIAGDGSEEAKKPVRAHPAV